MTMIEVEGLSKSYGGTVAVDEARLQVGEGEIFGILGRNGAGKTTLVECIQGLRAPDRGRVRIMGLDPQNDRQQLRQLLGAQLQQSRLPAKLRVSEAVHLYRAFYHHGEDPDRLLTALGLSDKVDAYYEHLSGGQQQRLSAALALVGAPRVAVLDELTTGLDPHSRRDAWQLIQDIRDRGVTILLVTHFMDEAERLCDRLALMEHGRVVAVDTPAGLITRAEPQRRTLEDAFIALTRYPLAAQGGDQP